LTGPLFKLNKFKKHGKLAFQCAQYTVCTWIVQEQLGGKGEPGCEGETWGDSQDEFALGEGEGEAAVDVG